ncbi:expressed unknown protein [Seminavis robusta]|uniref:Uncharacterized protein n=1 Tax=Seminavis robusta TaxID=568900 RepID=A0A9N8E8V1_9STRA|nr:expressed unknown protein [Seminavis robusta]|eukprot:Sro753_g197260.1 n/a (217) ;mRNA; r:82-848
MWGYGNTSPFDIITHLVTKYVEGGDVISDRNAVRRSSHSTSHGPIHSSHREWNNVHPENRTLIHFKEFFRDAENVRQTETTVSARRLPPTKPTQTITDTQTVSTGTSTLTQPQLIDKPRSPGSSKSHCREPQAPPTTPPPPDRPNRRSTTRANTSIVGLTAAELDAMGWCWTHGYCHHPAHNSETCNFPKKGHNIQATAQNKMVGSNERYQPRRGN